MSVQEKLPKPSIIDAIALAIQVHAGQIDKVGKPYISHPMRVMQAMDTEVEQIIAILHDVVEDSPMTIDDLQSLGYSKKIVSAIDCLSKREGEEYFKYLDRVKSSQLAIKIKLADLNDNLDPNRIPDEPEEKKTKRINRYRKAIEILTTT